jgi:hypothetical protein
VKRANSIVLYSHQFIVTHLAKLCLKTSIKITVLAGRQEVKRKKLMLGKNYKNNLLAEHIK